MRTSVRTGSERSLCRSPAARPRRRGGARRRPGARALHRLDAATSGSVGELAPPVVLDRDRDDRAVRHAAAGSARRRGRRSRRTFPAEAGVLPSTTHAWYVFPPGAAGRSSSTSTAAPSSATTSRPEPDGHRDRRRGRVGEHGGDVLLRVSADRVSSSCPLSEIA